VLAVDNKFTIRRSISVLLHKLQVPWIWILVLNLLYLLRKLRLCYLLCNIQARKSDGRLLFVRIFLIKLRIGVQWAWAHNIILIFIFFRLCLIRVNSDSFFSFVPLLTQAIIFVLSAQLGHGLTCFEVFCSHANQLSHQGTFKIFGSLKIFMLFLQHFHF